ncbi:hypothetical protein [Sanguibacter inulinus]|uniref:Uncharacterized protein n=1 Tax=Sanguibacter inulinus TaxID=60922 RepID=A0A853EXF1_9MICO|nr:hypothetical protein [Sanguibacter inulinus]MBF0724064.1 hypothetical protein [Sanguibacter inulinus]NYS95209.1 hypothetical protein [Sanguibacter inulinus]
MHGQKVCKMHGGMAGQNRAAAARRIEEEAARAAVVTLGLPVDISPSDALLEEVRWTAGHVQWLRAKVQQLEDPSMVRAQEGWALDDVSGPRNAHALTWGQTEYRDTTGGENAGTTTVEKAAPSIWYDLYERERKNLVTVCTAALKAGVEERRVQLAEAQGQQVAGAIRAILADLGLSSDQQARVSEVVPRHLRLLAGGA